MLLSTVVQDATVLGVAAIVYVLTSIYSVLFSDLKNIPGPWWAFGMLEMRSNEEDYTVKIFPLDRFFIWKILFKSMTSSEVCSCKCFQNYMERVRALVLQ